MLGLLPALYRWLEGICELLKVCFLHCTRKKTQPPSQADTAASLYCRMLPTLFSPQFLSRFSSLCCTASDALARLCLLAHKQAARSRLQA